MKNKIIWVVVVVVVIVLIILGVSRRSDDDKITIVAMYPLTGGLASWGEASRGATEIAIEEINNDGGINGKELQVIYEDHKCDPRTALSIFEKLFSRYNIFTSSSCSGTVLSIAPNLEQKDAFLLATVVASEKISSASPYLFRNWTVETNQALLLSEQVRQSGYKNIGVFYEETDYGKGLKIAFEKDLNESGIEIVSESFASGSTDLRTSLIKMKALDLDVLFLSPQTESSSDAILSQMQTLDFRPKLLLTNDIVLSSGTLLSKYPILESAIGGVYQIETNAKLVDFSSKYMDKYGSECAHLNACAIAYDSMYIIKEALANGNTTPKEISNYLGSINYDGLTGTTRFNDKNDRDEIGYRLGIVTDGNVVNLK